jgi:hypothetical protein
MSRIENWTEIERLKMKRILNMHYLEFTGEEGNRQFQVWGLEQLSAPEP